METKGGQRDELESTAGKSCAANDLTRFHLGWPIEEPRHSLLPLLRWQTRRRTDGIVVLSAMVITIIAKVHLTFCPP